MLKLFSILTLIFVLLNVNPVFSQEKHPHHDSLCNHKFDDLSGLSYFFIENQGQWEDDFLYKAYIPDGFLYLEPNGLTYSFYDGKAFQELKHNPSKVGVLKCHAVKIRFKNCNKKPEIIKEFPSIPYYNYFRGNDQSKWKSGVRAYGRITYKNVYPNIDYEIYSFDGQVKFNFIVHPQGNPQDIKIEYIGTTGLELEDGHLHISTSINEFLEVIPRVYQIDDDGETDVECNYILDGNTLMFELPLKYDLLKTLVIDPVVIFSSFSGSWADNFGYTATYDDSGYAYSGGTVFFDSFPVTPGAYQRVWGGGVTGFPSTGNDRDIGVLKYTPDGKSLVYATYLGGSGNEDPHSMVVNSNYELIIFGNTNSTNFPIGKKFYDSTYNDSFDIYLAKLSIDGKILKASTYIGGSGEDGLNGFFTTSSTLNQSRLGYNYGDAFRGEVIVDGDNNVYIASTTKSSDFPYTAGVFQTQYGGGLQDACVVKLSPDLDNLISSAFIGGNNDDAGYALALNSSNDIYVVGGTRSTNLKMVNNKYQDTFQGNIADGYIYFISNDFKTLKSSTFFGTDRYDQIYFVQTDREDNVYVTGQTRSSNFMVKNVKYTKYRNNGKLFISKLNAGLDSLIYSTTFGSGDDFPNLSPSAFLVDYCERVYLSGWGGTTNAYTSYNQGFTYGLPTSKNAPQTYTDGSDFYVAVFARNIDTLLYATYWGDNGTGDHVDGGTSRFDKNSIIYQSVCAGCSAGASSNFPTTPGAWSNTNNGHRPKNSSGVYTADGCNNAIFKIDLDIPDLEADFIADTIFCRKDSTSFINKSYGAEEYIWDLGDGATSYSFEPRHVYADTGLYLVTLIAKNLSSCDQYDTISKYIYVYDETESDFSFLTLDCKNHYKFFGSSKFSSDFKWDFGDTMFSYIRNPSHIYKDTGWFSVTMITDSGTVCENKVTKKINVPYFPFAGFGYDIDTCEGKAVFTDSSKNSTLYLWYFGDGDTSHLKSPVHYYQSADTFTIVQIAEPNTVCADTATKELVILTPKSDAITEIDTCTFKVKFLNPTTYTVDKSIWYLGDGDSILYKDSFIHQYDSAGNYEIILYSNSGTLCQNVVHKNIDIPPLPIAKFDQSTIECHTYANFYDSSFYGYKYLWNFGNGASSVKQFPDSVQYKTAGEYIISLVVYSMHNCVDSIVDTLHIDHLAIADFEVKNTECETAIELKNNSTQPGSYYWNYGDGNSSTDYDVKLYEYDTAGEYTVLLVVTDGACKDSIIKKVVINEPPALDFIFEADSCLPIVTFRGIAEGVIDNKYLWGIGDTSIKDKRNIDYEFNEGGDFIISLKINYDTICVTQIEKSIHVNNYLDDELIIPNVITPNDDGLNDVFKITGLNLDCDKYHLIIYNRWGEKVFETNQINDFWDGYTNGKKVSSGVYYYIFESSKLTQAGTVTVLY